MSSIHFGPISWERMIRAVEKVRERLNRAVNALEAAKIPYAVAGENAVAAWVSRVDESAVRNPAEVEIVLRREDFDIAKASLEAAGFRYVKVWVDLFVDTSSTRRLGGDRITVYCSHEKILGENDTRVPDVTESDSSGCYVILSLESLVRMNLATHAFKDRVGVLDLINVGLVNQDWLQRFTGEYAARLQRLLDEPDKFSGFS